jgi:hypothetical protein
LTGRASSRGTVSSEVYQAVATAFYTRKITGPDQARSRAQAAYAIGSAFAAGLVGVATLAGLATTSGLLRGIGGLSALVWVIAAAFYLHAITIPVRSRVPLLSASTRTEFVDQVVELVDEERLTIDGRQRRANMFAAIAAGLTAAFFIGNLIGLGREVQGTVLIDAATKTGGSLPCDRSALEGMIDVSSLRTEYVIVNVEGSACGGQSLKVRIPRTKVLALVEGR